jgi:hypothetical protein
MSGYDLLGAMRLGSRIVVAGEGFAASVQDADEPAREVTQRSLAAGVVTLGTGHRVPLPLQGRLNVMAVPSPVIAGKQPQRFPPRCRASSGALSPATCEGAVSDLVDQCLRPKRPGATVLTCPRLPEPSLLDGRLAYSR